MLLNISCSVRHMERNGCLFRDSSEIRDQLFPDFQENVYFYYLLHSTMKYILDSW